MKRIERFRCYYVSVSGSHQPQASLAKNLDNGKEILPDSAHSSDGLSDSDNDSDDDDPDTAPLKSAIDASKKSNIGSSSHFNSDPSYYNADVEHFRQTEWDYKLKLANTSISSAVGL